MSEATDKHGVDVSCPPSVIGNIFGNDTCHLDKCAEVRVNPVNKSRNVLCHAYTNTDDYDAKNESLKISIIEDKRTALISNIAVKEANENSEKPESGTVA